MGPGNEFCRGDRETGGEEINGRLGSAVTADFAAR